MRDVIELHFSLPPAGLRRNHEANRFAMNALKDAYSLTMYEESIRYRVAARFGSPCPCPLSAEVVWRQCGEGDTDNCLSALKPLFDNLGCAPVTKAGANRYYLGVYESDSQIKRICVERERVATKAEEGVTIRIAPRVEHRGPDHKGVIRNCIQEIHFCW